MHVAMSRQDSESPDIDRVKNEANFSSAYSREAVTGSEGRFVMPPVEPGKFGTLPSGLFVRPTMQMKAYCAIAVVGQQQIDTALGVLHAER